MKILEDSDIEKLKSQLTIDDLISLFFEYVDDVGRGTLVHAVLNSQFDVAKNVVSNIEAWNTIFKMIGHVLSVNYIKYQETPTESQEPGLMKRIEKIINAQV